MSIHSYARINGVDPANVEDLVTYRPASLRYNYSAFTTSATAGASSIIPYNTRVFDDANAWNTSTYTWTCPYAGVYMVTWQVGINLPTVNQTNLTLNKNGSQAYVSARGSTAAGGMIGFQEWPAIFIDRFVVGDTVQVFCAVAGQSSIGMRGAPEAPLMIGYLHP